MAFFAIVIVMILLQLWSGYSRLHQDSWFFSWHGRVDSALNSYPKFALAVTLLLPIMLLSLVDDLSAHLFWGLPQLALLTLMLLYCLGRGNYNELIDDYCKAWLAGDHQAALHKINRFQRGEAPSATTLTAMHSRALTILFYRAYERLFPILFWFVVGGIEAALLYRLIFLSVYRGETAEQIPDSLATKLLRFMDFIPERIFVLAMALQGNLINAMAVFKQYALDYSVTSQQFVAEAGMAAMGWDHAQLDLSGEEDNRRFIQQAASDIYAAKALLKRAAMVCLGLIAVLVILF